MNIVLIATAKSGPTERPALPLAPTAAAMTAGMSVASTAATLRVGEHAPLGLAGTPAAAGIIGTALGSVLVVRIITRQGYRAGLRIGYASALLGAVLCATVAQGTSAAIQLVALVLGALMIGVGNAAAQLSRYVAAELSPPGHRGRAIAFVVWITAFGAVGGPLLLGPSGSWATGCGIPAGSGPFLLAALCAALALVGTTALPARRGRAAADSVTPGRARIALFTAPGTRRAFVALAAAQVIMVAVMTAAPMNLHMHGMATTGIGTVVSVHTFGMFALSPLTAAVINRFGAQRVATSGLALLAASSATTAISTGPVQAIPLFLLGYGWNLCFIAGSTALAAGSHATSRLLVEGRVDALVWGVAAVAGLLSTVLLATGGVGLLAAVAVLLAAAAACYHTRKDHAHA